MAQVTPSKRHNNRARAAASPHTSDRRSSLMMEYPIAFDDARRLIPADQYMKATDGAALGLGRSSPGNSAYLGHQALTESDALMQQLFRDAGRASPRGPGEPDGQSELQAYRSQLPINQPQRMAVNIRKISHGTDESKYQGGSIPNGFPDLGGMGPRGAQGKNKDGNGKKGGEDSAGWREGRLLEEKLRVDGIQGSGAVFHNKESYRTNTEKHQVSKKRSSKRRKRSPAIRFLEHPQALRFCQNSDAAGDNIGPQSIDIEHDQLQPSDQDQQTLYQKTPKAPGGGVNLESALQQTAAPTNVLGQITTPQDQVTTPLQPGARQEMAPSALAPAGGNSPAHSNLHSHINYTSIYEQGGNVPQQPGALLPSLTLGATVLHEADAHPFGPPHFPDNPGAGYDDQPAEESQQMLNQLLPPQYLDDYQFDQDEAHSILKGKLQPSQSIRQKLNAANQPNDGIGYLKRDIQHFVPHQMSLLFNKGHRVQQMIEKKQKKQTNNDPKESFTDRQSPRGATEDVFSHSMRRFKDSILRSQIKMNADPGRWVPTGSLVHKQVSQGSAERGEAAKQNRQYLAPASFRITLQNKREGDPKGDQNSPSREFRQKYGDSKIQARRGSSQAREEVDITQHIQTGAMICQRAVINQISISCVDQEEGKAEQVPEKLNLKIQKVKDLNPDKAEKADVLIAKALGRVRRESQQIGSRGQDSLLSNAEQTDYRRPSLAGEGRDMSLPLEVASLEKQTDGTDGLAQAPSLAGGKPSQGNINTQTAATINGADKLDSVEEGASPQRKEAISSRSSEKKTPMQILESPLPDKIVEDKDQIIMATGRDGGHVFVVRKISEALREESVSAHQNTPAEPKHASPGAQEKSLTEPSFAPAVPRTLSPYKGMTDSSRASRIKTDAAKVHTQALQPIIQPIIGSKGSRFEGVVVNQQQSSSPRKDAGAVCGWPAEPMGTGVGLGTGQLDNDTSAELNQSDVEGTLGYRHESDGDDPGPTSPRAAGSGEALGAQQHSGSSDYQPNFLFKKETPAQNWQQSKSPGPVQTKMTPVKLKAKQGSVGNTIKKSQQSVGKARFSKGNEDISQFLEDGESAGNQESMLRNHPREGSQERGRNQQPRESRSGMDGPLPKRSLNQQSTDPKYKLVQRHDHSSFVQESSERKSPVGGGFQIHENSNYTIINYDGTNALATANQSKENVPSQLAIAQISVQNAESGGDGEDARGMSKSLYKDPKKLDKITYQKKFLVAQPALSCSPGITNVLYTRTHQFATAERRRHAQQLQLKHQNRSVKYRQFYLRRFERLDKMVDKMQREQDRGKRQSQKGTKQPSEQPDPRSLVTVDGKSSMECAGGSQQMDLTQDKFRDRSSDDSLDQHHNHLSDQRNSFYIPGSQGMALANQTHTQAFGLKTNSLMSDPQAHRSPGFQKFGGKKNTTQIFSNTIYMRPDQKFPTVDYQTPVLTPLNVFRAQQADNSQFVNQIFAQSDQMSYAVSGGGVDPNDYSHIQAQYDNPNEHQTPNGQPSEFIPNDYRQGSFPTSRMPPRPPAVWQNKPQKPHPPQVQARDMALEDGTFADKQSERDGVPQDEPDVGAANDSDAGYNSDVMNDEASLPRYSKGGAEQSLQLPELGNKSSKSKRLQEYESLEVERAKQRQLQQKRMLRNLQLKEQFQFQRLMSHNSSMVKPFNQTQTFGFKNGKADPKKGSQQLREQKRGREADGDKVRGCIDAQSLYTNKAGKLDKIISENPEGDRKPPKDRQRNHHTLNTFRRPKQSEHVSLVPSILPQELSRGDWDSNVDYKTCRNFAPANLMQDMKQTRRTQHAAGGRIKIPADARSHDPLIATPAGLSTGFPFKKGAQDGSHGHDLQSNSMSFRPSPGPPRPGAEDVKIDQQQPNDVPSMRAANWAGGAFEAGKGAPTELDLENMIQQMNTSTYRKHFDPNQTQNFGGFGDFDQGSQLGMQATKPKKDHLYRQLTNQRGEVIGYTTVYNLGSTQKVLAARGGGMTLNQETATSLHKQLKSINQSSAVGR